MPAVRSLYSPTPAQKERITMIRQDFAAGYAGMFRPRREFNDLSMVERDSIDSMAWAVYQPNDGDGGADETQSWRSNAVRPITRNKVFSIAAHVTAHTLFPRIHAFDDASVEQHDAAQVMSDLMEWSIVGTNASFANVSLRAVIAALVKPVSIVGTQYREVYRTVKRGKNKDGTYKTEQILDEDLSGFQDESIPPDQVYIQDFYQPDMQKQGWVIRRRVRPYTLIKTIYPIEAYPNVVYVRPGVQVVFNDANQSFYEAYDLLMAQDECEEVIYHNKQLDLELHVVNGILLDNADNPNPREDKLYPYASFGYELLRPNGDCFYYKSLAFKTMPDDKIANTVYPMVIDGSYLALMPPVINVGGEIIASDVIAPGKVTTLTDPNSSMAPLLVQSQNLKAGFDALMTIEKNITEDAFQALQQGDQIAPNTPALAVSAMEKNAKIMLGPFLQMVGEYVRQMGRLRIGDIKQYMTLPQVAAIEGSAGSDLVYKTFMLPANSTRSKGRKIAFTDGLPEKSISHADHMKMSYDTLKEEGGIKSPYRLYKVNPVLWRNMKYMLVVSPDVLAPLSSELEMAMNLETFDKMIQSPPGMFDPQETAKLLLESNPTTKKHPEKYLGKTQGQGAPPAQARQVPGQPQGLPQTAGQQQISPAQAAPSMGGMK